MFAFERTKLKDWVADIKQLIQKDLRGIPGWGAHTRCAQSPRAYVLHSTCIYRVLGELGVGYLLVCTVAVQAQTAAVGCFTPPALRYYIYVL
jgi:hypothetical protein